MDNYVFPILDKNNELSKLEKFYKDKFKVSAGTEGHYDRDQFRK